jgi:hypothetical protein
MNVTGNPGRHATELSATAEKGEAGYGHVFKSLTGDFETGFILIGQRERVIETNITLPPPDQELSLNRGRQSGVSSNWSSYRASFM